MKYLYLKFKKVFFLIFFLSLFLNQKVIAIESEDLRLLIEVLNKNKQEYEITRASNKISENDNLIDKFVSTLEDIEPSAKIELFQGELANITTISASNLLNIISKDLETNETFKKINQNDLQNINSLFSSLVPAIYNDDRVWDDNAYHLASIINNSSLEIANSLVNIVIKNAQINNNTKPLISNILLNIDQFEKSILPNINKDSLNLLINQSISELVNEVSKNKVNIDKAKIIKRSSISSQVAISESILLSSDLLSDKILQEIKNINGNIISEITLQLINQILDSVNWRNNDNQKILNNKIKFAQTIYPIGFSKMDYKKILVAEKVIKLSDPKISEIMLESIINRHLVENNNFFVLDDDVINSLNDMFLINGLNNGDLISSKEEAEALLKSLYITKNISTILLTKQQFLPIFQNLPKERFVDFQNVSPN